MDPRRTGFRLARFLPSTRAGDIARLAAVGLTYYGTAKFGLALAHENPSATAVWPPTGIALAAVVLWGFRIWPGVALGALLANAGTGVPLFTSLGIATGNTLEALVGGLVLLRVLKGFRPTFDRLGDVAAFALAALVCTPVSATFGVASLALGGAVAGGEVASVWRTWLLGDLAGALLVAPALLVFARGARPRPRPGRVAEAAALVVCLAGLSWLAFHHPGSNALLVYPALVLAALRFEQVGAVVSSLVLATVAVAFTESGAGAFAANGGDQALLLSQAFVAACAVSSLVLAAITTERRRAGQALRRARGSLEVEVEARTAELARSEAFLLRAQETAHVGSWEWDLVNDSVTWSPELYRIYGLDPVTFTPAFRDYLDLVHPQDRERVEQTITRGVEEQRPFQFDERIVRPDGTIRSLATQSEVVLDGEGRLAGMTGTCQDITERLRDAEELREANERARRVVEGAHEAFVAMDGAGTIVDWNPQAESVFGWSRAEAIGRSVAETLVPERYVASFHLGLERFLATGSSQMFENRRELTLLHRDGHDLCVEITIAVAAGADGYTFNGLMHDITERCRRQSYLATDHAVTQVLVEASNLDEARPRVLATLAERLGWAVGVWWDLDRRERVLRCEAVWAHPSTDAADFEEWSRKHPFQLGTGLAGAVWESAGVRRIPDLERDPDFIRLRAASRAGLKAAIGLPLLDHGEVVGVIELFATHPLLLEEELAGMMESLSVRIGEYLQRERVESALHEASERFTRAFADAPSGMALVSAEPHSLGRFLQVNSALCELTGYTETELLARQAADITHAEDVEPDADAMRRLIAGEVARYYGETRYVRPDGEIVWVILTASLIRGADGRPRHLVAQTQDITERKRYEELLRFKADHDPLTGLPNRASFEEELSRQCGRLARYGGGSALLMLDVDRLKEVNDTFGHRHGDRLIKTVAEVLSARLRGTDVIARLSGDEFAAILPTADEQQARLVGETILDVLGGWPLQVGGRSVKIGLSIGVTLFDGSTRTTNEELLAAADAAMYQAKRDGGQAVRVSHALQDGPSAPSCKFADQVN